MMAAARRGRKSWNARVDACMFAFTVRKSCWREIWIMLGCALYVVHLLVFSVKPITIFFYSFIDILLLPCKCLADEATITTKKAC